MKQNTLAENVDSPALTLVVNSIEQIVRSQFLSSDIEQKQDLLDASAHPIPAVPIAAAFDFLRLLKSKNNASDFVELKQKREEWGIISRNIDQNKALQDVYMMKTLIVETLNFIVSQFEFLKVDPRYAQLKDPVPHELYYYLMAQMDSLLELNISPEIEPQMLRTQSLTAQLMQNMIDYAIEFSDRQLQPTAIAECLIRFPFVINRAQDLLCIDGAIERLEDSSRVLKSLKMPHAAQLILLAHQELVKSFIINRSDVGEGNEVHAASAIDSFVVGIDNVNLSYADSALFDMSAEEVWHFYRNYSALLNEKITEIRSDKIRAFHEAVNFMQIKIRSETAKDLSFEEIIASEFYKLEKILGYAEGEFIRCGIVVSNADETAMEVHLENVETKLLPPFAVVPEVHSGLLPESLFAFDAAQKIADLICGGSASSSFAPDVKLQEAGLKALCLIGRSNQKAKSSAQFIRCLQNIIAREGVDVGSCISHYVTDPQLKTMVETIEGEIRVYGDELPSLLATEKFSLEMLLVRNANKEEFLGMDPAALKEELNLIFGDDSEKMTDRISAPIFYNPSLPDILTILWQNRDVDRIDVVTNLKDYIAAIGCEVLKKNNFALLKIIANAEFDKAGEMKIMESILRLYFVNPSEANCDLRRLKNEGIIDDEILANALNDSASKALKFFASTNNLSNLKEIFNSILARCEAGDAKEKALKEVRRWFLKNNAQAALYVAVLYGHMAVVDFFIECGFTKHLLDEKYTSKGLTLLYIATFYGNDKIVKKLLDAGCSVDKKLGDGSTAFSHAVALGNLAIVKLMLQHASYEDFINLGAEGITPLQVALNNNRHDIVEAILEALLKLPPEKRGDMWLVQDGKDILRFVVEKGDKDMVKVVFTKFAEFAKLDQMLVLPDEVRDLFWDVLSGELFKHNPELVKTIVNTLPSNVLQQILLIPNLSSSGVVPFIVATEQDYFLKLLFNASASKSVLPEEESLRRDVFLNKEFVQYSSLNSRQAIDFAITKPQLPNLSEDLKDIPGIHLAAYMRRTDIIDGLLIAGFPAIGLFMKDRDNEGKTPLQIAVSQGDVLSAQVILNRLSNISSLCFEMAMNYSENNKIFKLAIDSGNGQMVTLLLNHFLNLQPWPHGDQNRDEIFFSALYHASRKGDNVLLKNIIRRTFLAAQTKRENLDFAENEVIKGALDLCIERPDIVVLNAILKELSKAGFLQEALTGKRTVGGDENSSTLILASKEKNVEVLLVIIENLFLEVRFSEDQNRNERITKSFIKVLHTSLCEIIESGDQKNEIIDLLFRAENSMTREQFVDFLKMPFGKRKDTFLHLAIAQDCLSQNGNLFTSIAEFYDQQQLLEYGLANKNCVNETPLIIAICHDSSSAINLLVSAIEKLPKKDKFAQAIRLGDVDSIKTMLQEGFPVEGLFMKVEGETIFDIALRNKNIQLMLLVIQELQQAGLDYAEIERSFKIVHSVLLEPPVDNDILQFLSKTGILEAAMVNRPNLLYLAAESEDHHAVNKIVSKIKQWFFVPDKESEIKSEKCDIKSLQEFLFYQFNCKKCGVFSESFYDSEINFYSIEILCNAFKEAFPPSLGVLIDSIVTEWMVQCADEIITKLNPQNDEPQLNEEQKIYLEKWISLLMNYPKVAAQISSKIEWESKEGLDSSSHNKYGFEEVDLKQSPSSSLAPKSADCDLGGENISQNSRD